MIVVVLTSLAVVTAACGDDGGDAATETTTPDTVTTSAVTVPADSSPTTTVEATTTPAPSPTTTDAPATTMEAMEHEDETATTAPTGDLDLVVAVDMNEFGFDMEPFEVAAGSTVRFDFTNVGAIEHEAMFGSHHQQDEFAQMDDHGDHGHHGEIMGITLGPDETASLTTTFDDPGEMFIGCHLPGHYDAGMVTSFTVT